MIGVFSASSAVEFQATQIVWQEANGWFKDKGLRALNSSVSVSTIPDPNKTGEVIYTVVLSVVAEQLH